MGNIFLWKMYKHENVYKLFYAHNLSLVIIYEEGISWNLIKNKRNFVLIFLHLHLCKNEMVFQLSIFCGLH